MATQIDRQVRVRLLDVARHAGVTRTVAGKVLLGTGTNVRVSERTALRVREVAERLRYRPNLAARQLKGAVSKLLGGIIGASPNRAGQDRLFAFEREAHARGYRLIIGQHHYGEDITDALNDFSDRGVQWLVSFDQRLDAAGSDIWRSGRVIHTTRPNHPGAYCVELDRAAVSRISVEHLLAHGRRRPGLVLSRLTTYTARERLRGFVEACAGGGVSDAAMLAWVASMESSPYEQARHAIDELIGRQGCDALIAGSDRWAVYLLRALRERGLQTPAQVALVGSENLDLCIATTPELTSVDHNHAAFAVAAMNMIEHLDRGESLSPEERHVLIQPSLVVRQSA